MKRKLQKKLEELHQRYASGPMESDCDGDFDFGFAEGMKIAYDDMVENLAALLAEFYPEGQGMRRRRR
jgi:hypothetical protein